MAFFQVHCDESGKLADDYVVFAAAVAEESDWRVISKQWNALLSGAGIHYLHMKEAMPLKGEFRDWKGHESDRDNLLESLAETAIRLVAYHVQSPMSTQAFRRLAQADQERLRDLYYCGFEGLLKVIVAGERAPEYRFNLFCDYSSEYADLTLKLYRRMRMHQIYAHRFPSLTFADDMEFPPLQFADMLAYVRKQEYTRNLENCLPIIRRLSEILAKHGKDDGGHIVWGQGKGPGEARIERDVP
ncbi:MAG TPA: DUF3800 domain-containing protein [Bryobacteraceae bacterium]|nr:DUF3800 domain-containing protein [Bryobacteraceae bacterium]